MLPSPSSSLRPLPGGAPSSLDLRGSREAAAPYTAQGVTAGSPRHLQEVLRTPRGRLGAAGGDGRLPCREPSLET